MSILLLVGATSMSQRDDEIHQRLTSAGLTVLDVLTEADSDTRDESVETWVKVRDEQEGYRLARAVWDGTSTAASVCDDILRQLLRARPPASVIQST